MMKWLTVILLNIFLISCGKKDGKVQKDVYYTCSMDPQVIEYKPGKCPICKMPLTPVKKEQAQQERENELHLSDQQIQLGNITVDSLKNHLVGEEILLAGTVGTNQNSLIAISSRVMGRIEKLYFKSTGASVTKGTPLYEIYSDDLNLAIKEMMLAAEKKRTLRSNDIDIEKILRSVKNKLQLYGLTEDQIQRLETSEKPPYTIPILSKADGVIYSIDVKDGGYLMEGSDVMHLANYSTVWVEAQVYSDYLDEIRKGMMATVTIPALPDRQFTGKVSFINPELNTDSKINSIRIEIANSSNDIIPGTQAYVKILAKQESVLSLPKDAVIKVGGGSTIWVKTGHNTFKSVMVHTGLEGNGYIQILHGLNEGDLVVVTGAYLLNSEYNFKKGANPMEGHDMSKM